MLLYFKADTGGANDQVFTVLADTLEQERTQKHQLTGKHLSRREQSQQDPLKPEQVWEHGLAKGWPKAKAPVPGCHPFV